MADKSFVKLSRKILDWRWYSNANTFRVFIHLLLSANYADSEYENLTVERGQVVTTYPQLSKKLDLSLKEVRTAIRHLTETGETAVASYPKFSVISILNYDLYQTKGQSKGHSDGQSRGSQGAVKGQHKKNNKNNKNYKEKEIYKEKEKHKYGEYGNVLLTDYELSKLKERFLDWQERIERLSIGIELKGYQYKSHYLAIIKWSENDRQISKPKQWAYSTDTSYDISEIERKLEKGS